MQLHFGAHCQIPAQPGCEFRFPALHNDALAPIGTLIDLELRGPLIARTKRE
jgi:hypothetical protein